MNKPLYDRDFYAWTQEQADAIRRRSVNELDWENLFEEIESLGKSQRRELESRLKVLLVHLLKWDVQISYRCGSWARTIREQRRQVDLHLGENPSLRATLDETFAHALRSAIVAAVVETGLAEADFIGAEERSFEGAMVGEVAELALFLNLGEA